MSNHHTATHAASPEGDPDIVIEWETHGPLRPIGPGPGSRRRTLALWIGAVAIAALAVAGLRLVEGGADAGATEIATGYASEISYVPDADSAAEAGEPTIDGRADDDLVSVAPQPCAHPAGQGLPVSVRSAERWIDRCLADLSVCTSGPTTADALERCVTLAQS